MSIPTKCLKTKLWPPLSLMDALWGWHIKLIKCAPFGFAAKFFT